MSYCLNQTELECILSSYPIEDENLKLLIDNANQWQDKVIFLTFSLARNLAN